MRIRTAGLIGVFALVATLVSNKMAHAQAAVLSTGESGGANWCRDSGTYCWNDNGSTLAGLRIIGEPKFGIVFTGGENRVSDEGFGKLAVIGLETNLAGSLAAFQLSIITPGRVTLDDQSPLRTSGRLLNSNGEIDVDGGVALGISLFDGIFTFGYGALRFDSRDITNPTSKEKKSNYGYLNIQGVSAVRAFVKQTKPE